MLVADDISYDTFEDQAMKWLNATRKEAAPKTTGRRLTSLRAFAKWAGWEAVLTDYSTPTPAKPVPHPLPEGIDGVRRMLVIAKYDNERALVALCGLCGLRVSEALSVIPHDFDLESMTLTIRGKGDKTRIVPVSREAWNILAPAVTRAYCGQKDGGSVVDMYDRQARRCVTRLGRKAKLKRHISSHDLRATFATAVYDKTMDIRLVQDLLGHSSVETTQVYTGVGMDKMKKGVEL
jgi:site-specific recombinase XerD